jgi:hypothetical protein
VSLKQGSVSRLAEIETMPCPRIDNLELQTLPDHNKHGQAQYKHVIRIMQKSTLIGRSCSSSVAQYQYRIRLEHSTLMVAESDLKVLYHDSVAG